MNFCSRYFDCRIMTTFQIKLEKKNEVNSILTLMWINYLLVFIPIRLFGKSRICLNVRFRLTLKTCVLIKEMDMLLLTTWPSWQPNVSSIARPFCSTFLQYFTVIMLELTREASGRPNVFIDSLLCWLHLDGDHFLKFYLEASIAYAAGFWGVTKA